MLFFRYSGPPYLAGYILSNIDNFVQDQTYQPSQDSLAVIDTVLYVMEPAVGLVFFFLFDSFTI
jgi:hypothetical protein